MGTGDSFPVPQEMTCNSGFTGDRGPVFLKVKVPYLLQGVRYTFQFAAVKTPLVSAQGRELVWALETYRGHDLIHTSSKSFEAKLSPRKTTTTTTTSTATVQMAELSDGDDDTTSGTCPCL